MAQQKKKINKKQKSSKQNKQSVVRRKKPARAKVAANGKSQNSRVTAAAMPLLVKLDALDRKLLQLTQGPYTRILKSFELGRKKLDEEKRLALMMSERILKKAREVRKTLKRSVRI